MAKPVRGCVFYLMHGREAKLPLEIENSNVVSDVVQLGDIQDTIDRLTTLRAKIFADASKNIDSAQKKQKEQYQQRSGLGQAVPIKEGDLVQAASEHAQAYKERSQRRGHMVWSL